MWCWCGLVVDWIEDVDCIWCGGGWCGMCDELVVVEVICIDVYYECVVDVVGVE